MQHAVQMLGFHVFLTGKHFIRITLNGIDLTVMHDKSVRMGSLPAWIGIGRETGMYHGNGRFEILILQIRKESTELSNQEHSFIYDRPAG